MYCAGSLGNIDGVLLMLSQSISRVMSKVSREYRQCAFISIAGE